MSAATIDRPRLRSVTLGRGVRLHVLPTDRFTTTLCRVVLHRDLGPEATATALLGQVLEQATERHPTREAVAARLADLYGAGLSVGVEKLGERQLLTATLDWPSAGLPGRGATLAEGLSFLGEVLARPKRGPDGLDPDLVASEARNLARTLAAVRDDKGRYALRRCLETACAGEAFALDPEGRPEDIPAATPRALADLHARLLATAPVEVFLAGDLDVAQASAAVRRHLLWPGRAARPAAVPPAAGARPARPRPRLVVERDTVAQGKVAMAFRGSILPDSPLAPAAQVLAGVLGGSPVARLFKVLRETEGLCYYASAAWVRAKGLLLVQSGADPANEARLRRGVVRLFREVASGRLDPLALSAVREAAQARLLAMRDERGLAFAFAQEASALGLDPRPERHVAALLAVTPSDVRRAGRRLALDASFVLTAAAPPPAAIGAPA